MLEDVAYRARALVRSKAKVVVAELTPHRGDLVRFARIRVDRVLNERLRRNRNRMVGDRDEGIGQRH
jgi:hypothetical protein